MQKKATNSSTSQLGSVAALAALYEHPLPSSRAGPLYNAFSYPTKISPEAIALYIATHTAPGATVLDAFAGSGTTGLAAKLCDRPTSGMRQSAISLGLNPIWGPRHAVLYELSTIGSFVAKVMCAPIDSTQFEIEARLLVAKAYEKLQGALTAIDDLGQVGTIRHVIWSDVLICPSCHTEHTFWDVGVKQAPLGLLTKYVCSGCNKLVEIDAAGRATESVYDTFLGKANVRRRRVPVRVYGKTGRRRWQRPIDKSDYAAIAIVDRTPIPAVVPIAPLNLADLYRAGYHTGITHLHHLYTRRNLLCLATLWELIEEHSPEFRDALRLLVLSYNQSHSTLMTRVVVKDGGSDFVLTGAQSGVLYISSLPVEKNILEGVLRKISPFKDSFCLIDGSKSTVVVHNSSSTHILEDSESIDYVFTDPPFGDYIPYSEINQINELWLGRITNQANEAIVSVGQGKTIFDYAELMRSVFGEIGRVLRSNGSVTIVFHSAKAAIWAALQRAYLTAGLTVRATSVLDKLQSSFKQTVSTVSVKGDPLLLLTKSDRNKKTKAVPDESLLIDLLSQARGSLDRHEITPERLYSRYVARYLKMGLPVPLNADAFYILVRDFTN